jgi:chemotaxis protein CheC
MEIKLSKSQLGILKEIETIGVGNAATGLARMLNKRVDIKVPAAAVAKLEKVPGMLGGPDKQVAAVYFQVVSKFSGSAMLVFPMAEAFRIAEILLNRPKKSITVFDELSASAIKELGNIYLGAYLAALFDFLKISFKYSVPSLVTDMLQAVLDGILIQLALEAESAVVLDTEFSIEQEKIRGLFIFLPDPEGIKTILNSLNNLNVGSRYKK